MNLDNEIVKKVNKYMPDKEWSSVKEHLKWLNDTLKDRPYMKPTEYVEVLNQSIEKFSQLDSDAVSKEEYEAVKDDTMRMAKIIGLTLVRRQEDGVLRYTLVWTTKNTANKLTSQDVQHYWLDRDMPNRATLAFTVFNSVEYLNKHSYVTKN